MRLTQGAAHAAAIVGVVTETNAEKAIEELKAYEVQPPAFASNFSSEQA